MKPQDVYQEVNNLLFHELKSLGKVSTGNNQPWNGQEFTYWNWALTYRTRFWMIETGEKHKVITFRRGTRKLPLHNWMAIRNDL